MDTRTADASGVNLDMTEPDPEPDGTDNPAVSDHRQPTLARVYPHPDHERRNPDNPDTLDPATGEAAADNSRSPLRFTDPAFVPIGGNLSFQYPPPPDDERSGRDADNPADETDDRNCDGFPPPPPDLQQQQVRNQDDAAVGSRRAPPGAEDSSESDPGDWKLQNEWGQTGQMQGLENEAYDGDADTDHSAVLDAGEQVHGFPLGDFTEDVPATVLRNKDPRNMDPFPVLDRPVSGRYTKNPSVERKKPQPALGPYDPHSGLYLTPPVVTKTSQVPTTKSSVRKRIPRPPTKLQVRCVYAWACVTCLLGNFLCAIPALRYTLTASESGKVHDYNSARSYLRKAVVLCVVGLALAVGGWTILLLYLTGNIGA